MSQTQLDFARDVLAVPPSGKLVSIGGINLSYKVAVTVCQVAVGALLLGGWELGSGHVFDEFWFSSPSAIVARLAEGVISGVLLTHGWVTLLELVCGFVFGSLVGIATGLLLGANAYLRRVMTPFMIAAYSIPVIALAPLFILWFGIGLLPKLIIVAMTVYFLVFFNVFFGIQEIDSDLVDSVRMAGGNSRAVFLKVLTPATLPWALAGIRISIPYAIIAAVVAEMIGARAGLGYLIYQASGMFNTTMVFAVVTVLTLLAILADRLAALAEKHLLGWRQNWAEGDRS